MMSSMACSKRLATTILLLTLCVAVASDGVAQTKTTKTPAKTAATSGGKSPERFVLRHHEMRDVQANNMISHTILVPAGWTLEGGAWYPNLQLRLFRMNPSREVKVTSPEGVEIRISPNVQAVDYFPEPGSPMQRPQEGTVDDGLMVLYLPTSLDAWKTFLLNRGLPGAFPKGKTFTIKEATVDAKATAELHKNMIEPLNQQLRQQPQIMPGFGSVMGGEVWTAAIQFEEGGKTWDLYVGLAATWLLSGTGTLRCTKMHWSSSLDIAVKVPAGQADAWNPIIGVIFRSFRETPEWDQYVQRIIMKRAGADVEHGREMSKIIQKSGDDMRRSQLDAHQSRMASKDRTSDGRRR